MRLIPHVYQTPHKAHIYFSIILLTLLSFSATAERQIILSIDCQNIAYYKDLDIAIDVGHGLNSIQNKDEDGEFMIIQLLASKYAYVEFTLPSDNPFQPHLTGFFLSEGSSNITIKSSEVPLTAFDYSEKVVPSTQLGEKEFKVYTAAARKDFHNFYASNQPLATDSLLNIARQKADKVSMKEFEFIQAHPTFYYSYWLFRSSLSASPLLSKKALMDVLHSFPKEFTQYPDAQKAIRKINGRHITKGQQAFDFTAQTLEGNELSLNSLRGKYVILHFWATWCKPCMKEIAALHEISNTYKDNSLVFVNISADQEAKTVKRFLAQKGLVGHHLMSTDDLIDLYGVQAIPKVYLIAPDGTIIYHKEEENDDLQLTKLKTLLATQLSKK